MSALLTPPAMPLMPRGNYHRFSVDDYHEMIERRILTEEDHVELIEGILVNKMPRDPKHDYVIQSFEQIISVLPAGYCWRIQSAVTLVDSVPEPDLAIVRGKRQDFKTRHPGPAEVAILMESSNSSVDFDRDDKCRVYARAGVSGYWIFNIVDEIVEVYSQPSGPCDKPAYASRKDYPRGASVPLVLDGVPVAEFAVNDLLP